MTMLSQCGRFASSLFGLEAVRGFHTTAAVSAGARWRFRQGKERHINLMRALADAPCWSRLDGRPAPLNPSQMVRYNRQIGYNQRIQQLLHQMDEAQEQERRKRTIEEETKQQIIAHKLHSKARRWNRPQKTQT